MNHVTAEEIEKLESGALEPDDVLRVGRHLGACSECAARASSGRALQPVAEMLDFGDAHPDLSSALIDYVDGTLPAARRAEIAAHLAECEQCSADVQDFEECRRLLASAPAGMGGRTRRRLGYAAAALAAAAAVAFVVWPRGDSRPSFVPTGGKPPVASSDPYGNPEWSAAVRDAVRSQRIAPPAVFREVRQPPDPLRGSSAAASASVQPAGVILDATVPQFRWTASDGARYVVYVFAGRREVASSGEIAQPYWVPSHPLAPGTTYNWQVEIRRHGSSTIIPAPPRPPAMFRIADARTVSDLRDAQRRFPDDHLLLGVLYARAGLQARAEEELSRAGSPAAEKLLQSIRAW